jgi:hypothetical protein
VITEEEQPFSPIAVKGEEFAGFSGSASAWC